MTQNCRVFTKEVTDTTRKIQALSFYARGRQTDFFKSEQKGFVSVRKSIDRDAFRPFSIRRLTIKKKTIDGRGRTRASEARMYKHMRERIVIALLRLIKATSLILQSRERDSICRFVRRLVGPSVGPSVGPLVGNTFARRAETSRQTTYFVYMNLFL